MFYFVNSPRWIVPVHKDEADQSFSPVQQCVAFSHSDAWRDGGAETWGNLFPFPSDHLYSWNGIHAQHPFPFPLQSGCSSSCICVVPQLFHHFTAVGWKKHIIFQIFHLYWDLAYKFESTADTDCSVVVVSFFITVVIKIFCLLNLQKGGRYSWLGTL